MEIEVEVYAYGERVEVEVVANMEQALALMEQWRDMYPTYRVDWHLVEYTNDMTA
jgi:hypothetical protein